MADDQDWSDLLASYGEDAAWLAAEVDDWVDDLLIEHSRLIANLRNFLAATANPATELRSLRQAPHALQALLRLCVYSRYGLQLVLNNPHSFWSLIERGDYRHIDGRARLMHNLGRRLRSLDDPEHRLNDMIRFHQYHTLRLIIGDIMGVLTVDNVVVELSNIADVLINQALRQAEARLAPRYGRATTGFTIFALGKLGARELNYSSDIDLMFLYGSDAGQTSGGARDLDHHDYFRRLAAAIIEILDAHHAAGRLYRVDMRLRPDGAAGEIVMPLDAAADYYFSNGRPWERQALLKLRCCAGDHQLGQSLMKRLRPWLFPRELHQDDAGETRIMRLRIEERADENDVKTGAGGIRDIEFLVQFYQLRFGGRTRALRVRDTLRAIEVLRREGLLTQPDADLLSRHYRWLRMVEHRLQMYEARQLHRIPEEPWRRALLARSCGFTGPEPETAFARHLDQVREDVRKLSQRHYLDLSPAQEAFGSLLASPNFDPQTARHLLAGYGLRDLEQAGRRLRELGQDSFFILSQSRTTVNLAALLPELLPELARAPEPDDALRNFATIAAATGNRALFYERLSTWPRLRQTFAELCGWATFIVDQLVRFPGLGDEMVERMLVPGWDEVDYHHEAAALIAGLSDPLPPLAYLKARELATIAIRDLQGDSPARVARLITRLHVALVDSLWQRVVADRAAAWGHPGASSRMAILGLGKLGSAEMGYASDLDIIFVCDGQGQCPQREDRSTEDFFTRAAQDLLARGQQGGLLDIDARLRPWGEQGQMVITLTGLRDYWAQPRDLWERMAMLRVTPIAGDLELGQEAAALIRAAALGAPPDAAAAAEIRAMRQRLEDSVAGKDHVKRGPGGYVDIEFLVQFLSLGRSPESIPAGAPIRHGLARLASMGLISVRALRECGEALDILRQVEARMRLETGHAISHLPNEEGQRRRFARIAGYDSLEAMDRALFFAREHARQWFDCYVR